MQFIHGLNQKMPTSIMNKSKKKAITAQQNFMTIEGNL